MNGRDGRWEGNELEDEAGDGRGGSEEKKNVLAAAQLDHYPQSHGMWCSAEGESDSWEMRDGLLDWSFIICAAAPG